MSDFVAERSQDLDASLPPSLMSDRSRDSSREVLGSYEEPPEQPQGITSRESLVLMHMIRHVYILILL
jgi:hypothetical protein